MISILHGVMDIIVVDIENILNPLSKKLVKREATWFNKIEPVYIKETIIKDESVHSLAQH